MGPRPLPDPAYSFTIASLHDDAPLDCRIYHPHDLDDRQSGPLPPPPPWKRRAAVLAHPYAPLGGSYDDPVVAHVGAELLAQGWVLGTFNFRGAGTSAGRTSWTGKAELADYVSFAGALAWYVDSVQAPAFSAKTGGAGEADASIEDDAVVRLILGGYSYGSLIATRLPPVRTLLDSFRNPPPGSAAAEILLRARSLAARTSAELHELQDLSDGSGRGEEGRGRRFAALNAGTGRKRKSSVTVGGEEGDADARRKSREAGRRSRSLDLHFLDTRRRREQQAGPQLLPEDEPEREERQDSTPPRLKAAFILISPLLPPVSMFIAPSLPSPFSKQKPVESGLLSHPTLALFGRDDAFTSAKKLRAWAEKLALETRAGLIWEEIEGAGHFWLERGAMMALRKHVRAWLGGLGREG